jgi:hypothetical protein
MALRRDQALIMNCPSAPMLKEAREGDGNGKAGQHEWGGGEYFLVPEICNAG